MVSNDVVHAEQGAWKGLAPGWRQLYGDFDRLGVSIEWHDFRTERTLDWGRSFHPHSLEFCLNLDGRGAVGAEGEARSDYLPGNAGYYAVADEPLPASRHAHDHHQFVTLEFSRNHLQRQFVQNEVDLEPARDQGEERHDHHDGQELMKLVNPQDIKIRRHVKVKADANPYDP